MAVLLNKIFSKKNTDEKKQKDLNAFRILLKPLITEKATEVGALNKYEFLVSPSATRSQIAEMIEKIYGVSPSKVNIVKSLGKKVRHGKKFGTTKNKKKAIVTLFAGDKIEIYEGV